MGSWLVIWIVISVASLAIDIITSAFIFIWFSIGGITAIIANLLGYTVTTQIITFIFVSALFIAVGYPLVKSTIKKTVVKTPTTEQGYIGRELTVDEEIMERAIIKIDGIYWTIKNEGMPIKKGDRVKITGIEGNKLLIMKI